MIHKLNALLQSNTTITLENASKHYAFALVVDYHDSTTQNFFVDLQTLNLQTPPKDNAQAIQQLQQALPDWKLIFQKLLCQKPFSTANVTVLEQAPNFTFFAPVFHNTLTLRTTYSARTFTSPVAAYDAIADLLQQPLLEPKTLYRLFF